MPEQTVSDEVKQFYTNNPYPAYGTAAKTKAAKVYAKYCTKPGKYLEAGCGTGHVVAGSALMMPQLDFHGVDFSEASLAIAKDVAKANNVNIQFKIANLMKPLPFDFKFDYISCVGVLHHLENPDQGLLNLANQLSDDGYIFIHVYGEEYHRRRYQINEMLDLMTNGQGTYEERFRLFQAYDKHEKALKRGSLLRRIARLSLRDVILGIRSKIKRRNLEDSETLQAWNASWNDQNISERWLDQFAHPNERSYNLAELTEFLHDAGLELVEAFSLGRPDPRLVPVEWSDQLASLDLNTRTRLMELLNPRPTSPFVAARKIQTAN
jgi:SAM-dependent methyltransferase